jgi:DNA (cytosine-5)-methyltransferase 1
MTKLKVLSLFAGIGGFELGLERTGGFETVAQCEIDPFCRRVLAKHWPNVKRYEDVRTLTADTLRGDGIAVDVICGGFPCQDLSRAGSARGLDGERSGLWREYARLIGEVRPNYVFVENVTELLGRGMDRILGDLAALGYDAEWHCIPASSVGAPHPRERLWIVANTDEVCGDRSYFAALGLQLANGWQALGQSGTHSRWDAEPAVGRVVHGLPDGVDRSRIAALGNSVVPQIPELIGNAILEARRAA